ncbi:PREDICTED: pumilio homolog 18-like [Tarenaya hassleriana]|uniref:pumilio homolog 18-like n=1 Tax=Tarenaya hassleriana TaxID=28532 RepID=UPI00053C877E|nr:PREDICTED: pumilio homolog 18-like [Tarenaya hassleriana]
MFNGFSSAAGGNRAPPQSPSTAALELFWVFDLFIAGGRIAELASLVTGDNNLLLPLARDRIGSINLRRLLGRSVQIDDMFFDAVISVFLPIMKLKYGHHVAMQTVEAADREKKNAFYSAVETHFLELAYDENGCVALNEAITAVAGPHRQRILDLVAENAVGLSMDTSGNFVVQHVLKLSNPLCTEKIASKLKGHYVLLSFQKYGSYVVEKILWHPPTTHLVLGDLIECSDGELIRLAENKYGNYVLQRALAKTFVRRPNLYARLVTKLDPFSGRALRGGHARNVIDMVERFDNLLRKVLQ